MQSFLYIVRWSQTLNLGSLSLLRQQVDIFASPYIKRFHFNGSMMCIDVFINYVT